MARADPFGPRSHHHSEGQPPRRSAPAPARYGLIGCDNCHRQSQPAILPYPVCTKSSNMASDLEKFPLAKHFLPCPPAESGVKPSISGRYANALIVNVSLGYGDVGRDTSAFGGTGAARGPAGGR